MMILTIDAFTHACQYVETHGRSLEKARLHFHFHRAPASLVISELEKFQNPDGGFGNALESDIRYPGSSPLATSIAFQVLREINFTEMTKMIRQAISYLFSSCDLDRRTWRIIPVEAENWPHAPYWTQTGHTGNYEGFQLNPTAELLGYLLDFSPSIPGNLTVSILEKVSAHLASLDKILMHDFLCCMRLLGAKHLPKDKRQSISNELLRLLHTTVATDPSLWAGYYLRPIQAAPHPTSLFTAPLKAAIETNLDYEITTQLPDGSWPANFSWGDHEPELWPSVLEEWKCWFILENLLTLKRYDRIEGVSHVAE